MGSLRHGLGTAALLAVTVAATGLSPLDGSVASAQTPSPVTNVLGGPGHNAATDQALPGQLKAAWRRSLPGTVGTPLEKDGRVFVGAGGILYALSAADGSTLWAVDMGGVATRSYGVDEESWPVFRMALDGTTLVTSHRSDGLLVAYDVATGLVRWAVAPTRTGHYPGSYDDLVTGQNGVVYAGNRDAETVEARRVSTGRLIWSAPADSGPFAFADGLLLTQTQNNCANQALDPSDGTRRWLEDGGCHDSPQRPWLDDGEVAAQGALYEPRGEVLSLSSGRRTGSWAGDVPPVRAQGTTLTVRNGRVTATTAGGDIRWTYAPDGGTNQNPVVAGSTVYVAGPAGAVQGLDLSTGRRTWSAPLPTGTVAYRSMTVADGQLLVPSTHILTAFRGGEHAGPRPSAAPVAVPLPVRRPSHDVVNYLGNAAHDNVTGTSGLSHRSHRAWFRDLGGVVSAPLVSRRHVIVTVGEEAARLLAFDPRTGHRQWALTVRGGFNSFPVVAGGHVYVLTSRARLLEVDEDSGVVDGRVQLVAGHIVSPLTTDGTAVYVKGDNKIFAVPVDSHRKVWVTQVPGSGTSGTVAVSGSRVVWNSPCTTGALDRLTGKGLWLSSNGCDGAGGITPVVHGGVVYGLDDGSANRVLSVRTGLMGASVSADREPVAVGRLLFVTSFGVLRAEDAVTRRVLWTRASRFALPPLVVGDRLVGVTRTGTVVNMSARTGLVHWRDALATTAGSVDQNQAGPPAPAAAHGTLAVPVGTRLVVYRSNG